MKAKVKFLLACMASISLFAQKENFEGRVVFKNTMTSDKITQKLYPWARNGEFQSSVYLKNGNRYEENGLLDIKTLILKDGQCCVWNDLTKTGYVFNYSDYAKYLQDLQNSSSIQVVSDEVRFTGETQEVFGYTCKHYKGALVRIVDLGIAKVEESQQRDYWVCEDLPNINDDEDLPGMAFVFEFLAETKVPLMGSMQNYQSGVITSISASAVPDSFFEVPGDIDFKVSSDGYGATRKLAKEVRKYKKKHKIE